MSQTMIAQKQMTLAKTAQAQPLHRFSNLYSLMHWDCWIRRAADAVLARPGSSTAGVDGETRRKFKANYERQIAAIVESLKRKTYQPQPVRRVYIPKGNGKMRPLGIAVLRDRIVQEALRAILDPIYESDFQLHSYGFRKGRCTMDAISVIVPLFNTKSKHYYVIEGDIKSYFDAVQHRKLLSILKRRIADKDIIDLIWKFLKAGVMDGGLFARTDSGVPQGAIVSPLLSNVYLNEFDKWAAEKWNLDKSARRKRRINGIGNFKMVRFADDFVIVSNGHIEEVEAVKSEVKQFLETELFLELSEEKTLVTHVNDGFDFLGFHIRRVINHEGRWATHLRPSDKGKKRVKEKIKDLTSIDWTWMDEFTRLTTLNSIVRGWANYYRHTFLLRDIEEITRYTWHRYLLWLLNKHKGSRKQQLIKDKTRVIHNRTRWTAKVCQGEQILEAYQWLPTRKELRRTTYLLKGRDGFPHPYIFMEEFVATDYPMGETGPPESIYTRTIGVRSDHPNRNEPQNISVLNLKAKMRDSFRCQRCGAKSKLHVHHIEGTKSHRLANLSSLCEKCHQEEHGYHQSKST
jgi:RNA-directed DNA polymerase